MKTAYIIITALAIALAVVTYKLVETSSAEPHADAVTAATSKASSAAAIDNIMTRSSIRAYTSREVTPQQIDTLLRAAMAAPTARDCRPWKFVVITDRAILDTIAASKPNFSMAAEAQAAIVVCGDMTKAMEGDGRDYWIQDCSAAPENLLLAANALGLGAVWCGVYPVAERVTFVRSLLGLPSDLIPLNIIPIGYPKAEATPKQKYDPANIINR